MRCTEMDPNSWTVAQVVKKLTYRQPHAGAAPDAAHGVGSAISEAAHERPRQGAPGVSLPPARSRH